MIIDDLLNELKALTNIEILEKDDKAVKIKLLDFKQSEITTQDYIVVNNYDYYLIKALELAKLYKVKTQDGLLSLRDDIREVENHLLGEVGEDYILNNLKESNYDKDPYCLNRLNMYDYLNSLENKK